MRALYEATARAAKANRGFTLIELLVVVAIIAILAAIAIPQFGKYRKRSAASQVMADARNCLTEAVAEVTRIQMAGQNAGQPRNQYNNLSPNTEKCDITYGEGYNTITCTCTGKGAAQGITCTAQQQQNGGFTASCTGIDS